MKEKMRFRTGKDGRGCRGASEVLESKERVKCCCGGEGEERERW